ncbi:unnamed protein product [Choristocarpus tenellus]
MRGHWFAAVTCATLPSTAGFGFSITTLNSNPVLHAVSIASRFTVNTHVEHSRQRISRRTMLAAAIESVAVVGGGIGGLTTAIALQKLPTGVKDVQLFEKFDTIKPGIGAGIQINSGALVLARLGLGEAIKESGIPVKRILSRTVDGRVILDLDIHQSIWSDSERKRLLTDGGTPMLFTVMRDRLMQILSDALKPGIVNVGRDLASINETPEGTFLTFTDKSIAGPFDLVVGADGINGVVQKSILRKGGEGRVNPINSGIRIQFGVAPAGQRPERSEGELHMWFGGDTYALTGTYGGIGGDKYDMLAAVYQDKERQEYPSLDENASWDKTETKQVCLQRLRTLEFPQEVYGVAEACNRFFELGVYYRNPLQAWVGGDGSNILLLGDAAHAMPPNLGQGANQAIQDAYCLAECLVELNSGGHGGSLRNALGHYEAKRKLPVTSLLVKSAVVGALETLSGPFGEAFRANFFYGMWKVGGAERVFIDGATPKV